MKNYFLKIFCFILLVMGLQAQQNQSGLYVGEDFQGEMDLYEALDWITMNAQEGGEYSIVLKENSAVSSNVLDYEGKAVTISLKSASTDIQLNYATRSPSSSLFTVKKGVTFVLENGVELIGSNASRPPVKVDGGNFIMNGGAIKNSKVDVENWFGGGVDVLNGGSFIMNSGNISGNSCSGGGAGVNVGENSTFVMNGGIIENNIAEDGFGGGVFVDKNAAFTMNNGEITNNRADYGGGGVYVYTNGIFTMVDGIISKNFCDENYGVRGDGGGVFVYDNGEFVMQGGSITENEGGVYINSKQGIAKFTMNGGLISNNTFVLRRGNSVTRFPRRGVYVNGTFVMNNGIIEKNESSTGGGVYVANGTFIMNDGSIRENLAYGSSSIKDCGGGGVCVKNGGSFTMNGGSIENNRAHEDALGGGGVLVCRGVVIDGSFTMNGGTISGNTTTKSGGGVLVDGGTFIKSNTAGIIYGGETTDGKANQADQYGHAVYTKNGSRDSTARATMQLDSSKQGAEGGWE